MALWGALRRALAGFEFAETFTSVETPVQVGWYMTAGDLWRTQPHLRTVVDFLARNCAQLGLQTFQRVSDTDRRRLRDDPVARLLSRPNAQMTGYELIYGLVADLALYDEAFWILGVDQKGEPEARPVPPAWLVARGGPDAFTVGWFEFRNPQAAQTTRISADQMLWFHGWNPGRPRSGSSPMEALKEILFEQAEARRFRSQMWLRGGRFGGYLTRPAGARWDKDTRERFKRSWQAQYARDGSSPGGTPILEDGMTFQQVKFSAKDQDWLEGTKLSLAQVASVYQVNPTMVGLLDNANFSNVEAFRKMLYTDTLGPTLAMIESRINTFLVPQLTDPDVYVEFNVKEKLQGSFKEEAASIQSAVGRPWMTANEARALSNMPALAGDADQLVTPFNVLVGGQASPQDSGSQNRNRGVASVKATHVKAEPPERWEAKSSQVLADFFDRQRKTVLAALGQKADPDWWAGDRWDTELADDLYKLAVQASTELGHEQAVRLGFTPSEYDVDRTLHFLRAVAASRAGAVNATTRQQIEQALAAGDDPAHVFDVAKSQRTGTGAHAFTAAVAGFALVEATRQLRPAGAVKTWETGPNPRFEHALMDKQTVPVGQKFTNGADWPGDPVLGAEGVANCNCGVSVSF